MHSERGESEDLFFDPRACYTWTRQSPARHIRNRKPLGVQLAHSSTQSWLWMQCLAMTADAAASLSSSMQGHSYLIGSKRLLCCWMSAGRRPVWSTRAPGVNSRSAAPAMMIWKPQYGLWYSSTSVLANAGGEASAASMVFSVQTAQNSQLVMAWVPAQDTMRSSSSPAALSTLLAY